MKYLFLFIFLTCGVCYGNKYEKWKYKVNQIKYEQQARRTENLRRAYETERKRLEKLREKRERSKK